MPTKEEYSYLAGVMDSDGCFSFCKETENKSNVYPRLIVANTNEELLYWLKDTFGGNVRFNKKGFKDNWKPLGMWVLGRQKALDLNNKIFDYIISKHRQTLIFRVFNCAKKFDLRVEGNRLSKDNIDGRLYLAEQMKLANKKGVAVT